MNQNYCSNLSNDQLNQCDKLKDANDSSAESTWGCSGNLNGMVSNHSHVGIQQVDNHSNSENNLDDDAVEYMAHNCNNAHYMSQNNEFDHWGSSYSDDISMDLLPEIDDDVDDNNCYNLSCQSDKSYDKLCWDSQSKTGMEYRDVLKGCNNQMS